MSRLYSKIVLVTGAASGIGLATARAFASEGAKVILADLSHDALETAMALIGGDGGTCVAERCNVTDADAMCALAARITAEHGPLDILVNNAGIGHSGDFMEHDLAVWRKVFEVNVFGVVHGIRAFLPAMREAGGRRRIVNVASGVAVAPLPNMAAYAASKAAVRNLGEVLAMELRGSQISVHTVYPGIINTPIADPRMMSASASDEQKERLVRFYRTKGCSPDRVARDIVRGSLADKAHIFTGPLALSGAVLSRLSPSLSRRFAIATGRQAGFIA